MADRCNFCPGHVTELDLEAIYWCSTCGALALYQGTRVEWREPTNTAVLRNVAQSIVGNLDIAPFAIFGSAEIELMGELKSGAAQLCRLLGGGRDLLKEVRRG